MNLNNKSKYQILNELNEKYNVIHCEVTYYDEAEEFYREFYPLYQLSSPAAPITREEMDLVEYIYSNWSTLPSTVKKKITPQEKFEAQINQLHWTEKARALGALEREDEKQKK
jgi:hypothetical protein